MQLNTLIDQENTLSEIWEILKVEFQKACVAKRHPFRFVVLASAVNNVVNSRWVVFRKYTESGSFFIYTDARSEKVSEFKENNAVSLLLYHDRKKFQVRINGKVVIHHKNELTEKYWPGVKGSNDQSYTSELAPGTPIKKSDEAYYWSTEMNDENFIILEVIPSFIEALQLNGDKHIRAAFTANGTTWDSTFLVP